MQPLIKDTPIGITLGEDGKITVVFRRINANWSEERMYSYYACAKHKLLCKVIDNNGISSTKLIKCQIPYPFVQHTANAYIGKAGVAITPKRLFFTGGTPPYTFAIGTADGTNVRSIDGLSLNSSTGVLTGTPIECNTVNITLKITDSLNDNYYIVSGQSIDPRTDEDIYPYPSGSLYATYSTSCSVSCSASGSVSFSNVNGMNYNSNTTSPEDMDEQIYACVQTIPSGLYGVYITESQTSSDDGSATANSWFVRRFSPIGEFSFSPRYQKESVTKTGNLCVEYSLRYDVPVQSSSSWSQPWDVNTRLLGDEKLGYSDAYVSGIYTSGLRLGQPGSYYNSSCTNSVTIRLYKISN
jgi:hypothetical protein